MFSTPPPGGWNFLQMIGILREIQETVRDAWPSFETRMINREKRKRLRHAEGKMNDAELKIELNAIEQKRKERARKEAEAGR